MSIEAFEKSSAALTDVFKAAVRYVKAQEAHEARDWSAFSYLGLGSVQDEYERLQKAVETADELGMINWETACDYLGPAQRQGDPT
jgi:hypothetical protein